MLFIVFQPIRHYFSLWDIILTESVASSSKEKKKKTMKKMKHRPYCGKKPHSLLGWHNRGSILKKKNKRRNFMFSTFHGDVSGLNANKVQYSLYTVFSSTWNFTSQWRLPGKPLPFLWNGRGIAALNGYFSNVNTIHCKGIKPIGKDECSWILHQSKLSWK